MRNMNLSAKRCKGTDSKFSPTICPVRDACQRHLQIDLDRQLGLPPDVAARIETLQLPRVGQHECHFWVAA